MTYHNSLILVMLLSLVGVVGDFLLKKAGAGSTINLPYFIVGFLVYSSTAVGWYFAMKHLSLASIGVTYGVTTVLLLTAAGMLLGERLSYGEAFGVVTGIVTIIILFRFA